MKTHLIMTVGTGTAGPHSNLVLGLRNTLAIVQPDSYWLIPSASPDSTAVADLVRELHPQGFEPWSPSTAYHAIDHHDSIRHCRDTVAEVLRQAQTLCKTGDRILVNPTSGTKQMSAGATLAALDLEAGEIQFTVGERADGVVMTGSERLECFDPSEVFISRDLRIAEELSRAGSHFAAHRLLARYSRPLTLNALDHRLVASSQNKKLQRLVLAGDLSSLALCLHEWERQNYEAARQLAAACHLPQMVSARAPLQQLAEAAKTAKPNAAIVADLLHTGSILHQQGDHEASLFIVCRALETGLRLRLMEKTELCDPFSLEILRTLPIKSSLMERCEKSSQDHATARLGLKQIVEILSAIRCPLAKDYNEERRLSHFVGLRNEYTHAVRHIKERESQEFHDLVSRLFKKHLSLPSAPIRPSMLSCLPE